MPRPIEFIPYQHALVAGWIGVLIDEGGETVAFVPTSGQLHYVSVKEQHVQGQAVCPDCEHEWFEMLEDDGCAYRLECPFCGGMKGFLYERTVIEDCD